MTALPHPDEVSRTALLAAHDGSQPTLQAAIKAHHSTGVILCVDAATCNDVHGQAALLTAAMTATRAFGTTLVLGASPDAVISRGALKGLTLADALTMEGAQLAKETSEAVFDENWPLILIGNAPPPGDLGASSTAQRGTVLRATWTGWSATVHAHPKPLPQSREQDTVLAAIAAGALGIHEAFEAIRARPGSDAGFRDITLNLWAPDTPTVYSSPALAHAPYAWWLVGLGHLGQAYAWVISWLPYPDPHSIEVILQDADLTIPANHSTGLLTPKGSNGWHKTRLVATALERAGFTTQIIERRLGTDTRTTAEECHVALLGLDNLPTRRITSNVGWRAAIDVGLGTGPDTYSSLVMYRFPGHQTSGQIPAWTTETPTTIPNSPAFTDMTQHQDTCGVVELAGKAVGAAFVGATAACLAIAEATRELHEGPGHNTLVLDLTTMDITTAPATNPADIISTAITTRAVA